ncbi:Hypothetical protein Asd1617_06238 (plasmid) [Shigella dysenteriae 1617]|uniref:Uncharacterized protein n=1 Tax=Shigella dysenteriae 1617 TaxID=754093 RepID=A0A0A7A4G9_SHIDY|nr:Hypothetical protein Asd1617_06238 [Shigella dysenteriae 1617]
MAVTAAKSVMAFRVLTMAVDLCRLTTRTMNVNAGHERTSKARIIHQIQLIRGITQLIKFADKRHISMSNGRRRYSLWREFFKVRMTVLMPIFSVLAVSQTPAPLKAISVISSLMPGLRAS